jgi:hypothetical protein
MRFETMAENIQRKVYKTNGSKNQGINYRYERSIGSKISISYRQSNFITSGV